MRICMIGKYPPIQGGVSTRNYHMAHALAKRGHDVVVITNAREVELPWRLLMGEEDWARCEADYGAGSVRVKWTEPPDASQRFIPRNNPSVTKLASLAMTAHAEKPFDLVHSFYLEPYGVAGHLVSQALDLPHVVKTAGSDAGKLWYHPQFEPLYDQVLSHADLFIASGVVAKRAVEHGIDPGRIVASRGFQLDTDLFRPEGGTLGLADVLAAAEADDDARFRDQCWGAFRGERPHIGVYGKIGDRKGSFALLDALARARAAGTDMGLVAMAHGHPEVEKRFRQAVEQYELTDRVLQIPFLPHWRVPSFVRSCLAVCCLEQDFPITIHNPIVTQEVMSCGTCLIAATELLNKHTHTRQLVSGVNCVAIRDVNDTGDLSRALMAVAADPVRASEIGARGRRYVEKFDPGTVFAARNEALFERTIAVRPAPLLSQDESADEARQSSLTQMALSLMDSGMREACLASVTSESETPEWVSEILSWTRNCRSSAVEIPDTVTAALEVDCAIRSVDGASAASGHGQMNGRDPLFRAGKDWIAAERELLDMQLSRGPGVRLLKFDVEILPFLSARRPADLPANPEPGVSHLAVFPAGEDRNAVIRLDRDMALFLQECDGHQPVRQIAAGLGMSASDDLEAFAERLMSLLVEDVLAV